MQVVEHGRGRVLSSGNWSPPTWFISCVPIGKRSMTFTFLGDWSSPFSGGATTSTLIRSGNLRRSNLDFGDIYMFVSYACFSILKTFSRLRHSLSSASTFLPRLSTAPSIIHHMSKVSDFILSWLIHPKTHMFVILSSFKMLLARSQSCVDLFLFRTELLPFSEPLFAIVCANRAQRHDQQCDKCLVEKLQFVTVK